VKHNCNFISSLLRIFTYLRLHWIFFSLVPFIGLTSYGSNEPTRIDFTWSEANQSFQKNDESFPSLELFEGVPYLIRSVSHSGPKILIGETNGSVYQNTTLKNEIFNNGVHGFHQYCYFRPNSETPRTLIYFPEGQAELNATIDVIPFLASEPIVPATQTDGSLFGYSVAVDESDDLYIGNPGSDGMLGRISYFEKINDSLTFMNQGSVAFSLDATRAQLGTSLSHANGWIFSGAPDYNSFRGSVSIYKNLITNDFNGSSPYQNFHENDDPAGVLFGWDIAATPTSFAVSSLDIGNSDGGTVELYAFSSNEFELVKEFKDPASTQGNLFGYNLSINDDFLLVGIPLGGENQQGSAQLFSLTPPDYSSYEIVPSTIFQGDRFGHSVAMLENFIFVGAPFDDSQNTDSGAVYVFERNQSSISYHSTLYDSSNLSGYHFGTRLETQGKHLYVLSTSADSSPKCLVYALNNMPENNSTVIEYSNQISLAGVTYENGLDPFASSLAVSDGMVVIGFPQAKKSTDPNYTGIVQAFYNPAWTLEGNIQIPPCFLDENRTTIWGTEGSGSVSYTFQAIHPTNQPITWAISSTDLETGSFDLNSSTGEFSFEFEDDYFGTTSFELIVSADGNDIAHSFNVNIEGVNDAPAFEELNNTNLTATQNSEFYYQIMAYDIDSPNIILSVDSLPEGLQIDSDNSSITGIPSVDGNFSFTVTASDLEYNISRDFNIFVYPENSPPVALFNGQSGVTEINLVLEEDFSSISWRNILDTFSVSDPNSDQSISMLITKEPEHGILRVGEIFETYEDINYFSLLNYYGADTFEIKFMDDHDSSPQETVVLFNLVIEAVNDLPVVESFQSSFTLNLNELFLHDFSFSDPDGDSVLLSFDSLPGWIEYDGLRTISGVPTESDYQSASSFDLFVDFVDEHGGKVTKVCRFNLVPSYVPPSITSTSPLQITLLEDASFEGNLSCVFNDDPNFLVWSVLQSPLNGNVILEPSGNQLVYTYIADANFSGFDQFSISVRDSRASDIYDSINFICEVEPLEDAPYFTNYFYSGVILGEPWELNVEAYDADQNDILSLSRRYLSSNPSWWITSSKTSNNTWLLSGTPNSSNDVQIGLTLSDGSNTLDYNLTLRIVEDPGPLEILQSLPSLNILLDEDTTWEEEDGISVRNGSSLSTNWTISEPPDYGEFSYINTSDGSLLELKYQPNPNYFGDDRVVLMASNGYTSDSLELNFTVESVPDNPELINFPTGIIESKNETYHIEFNVTDGDGAGNLVFEFFDLPDWFTVTDENLTSNITQFSLDGFPTVEHIGLHPVRFKATSLADGLSTEGNFSINVIYANQPPVPQFSQLTLSVVEDIDYLHASDLIASDFESEADQLTWMILEQPQNGRAVIDSNGSNLRFIPESNSSKSETFRIGVRDNGYENYVPRTSEVLVSVNISQEDDPLIFTTLPTSDTAVGYEWNDESTYSYEIHAFDSDWPWQGYPTLKLKTPLPSWAKWENLGEGKAILWGNPSYNDLGLYNFKIEASGLTQTIYQDFQLKIRVDDYPPIFEKDSLGDSLKKLSVTILEDLHQGEVNQMLEDLIVKNIDYDSSSDSNLVWSIVQVPSSGAQISDFAYTDDYEESRITSFNYQPVPHFSGLDLFSLKVTEGDRSSVLPVEVVTKAVPDPPYFELDTDDNISIVSGVYFEVEYTAFDPDKQKLNFHLKNLSNYPAWLSIKSENLTNEYSTVTIGGIVPFNGEEFIYNLLVFDPTGRWSAKSIRLSK